MAEEIKATTEDETVEEVPVEKLDTVAGGFAEAFTKPAFERAE